MITRDQAIEALVHLEAENVFLTRALREVEQLRDAEEEAWIGLALRLLDVDEVLDIEDAELRRLLESHVMELKHRVSVLATTTMGRSVPVSGRHTRSGQGRCVPDLRVCVPEEPDVS